MERKAESLQVGDYFSVKENETHGFVVGKLKNGSFQVVFLKEWRPIATIGSTSGWYPAPVKVSKGAIPGKLREKIDKRVAEYKPKVAEGEKVAGELVKIAKELVSGGYGDLLIQFEESLDEAMADIKKAKKELQKGEMGENAKNVAHKLRGGAYVGSFYGHLFG